jgi:hypothetical protein
MEKNDARRIIRRHNFKVHLANAMRDWSVFLCEVATVLFVFFITFQVVR